MIDKGLSRRKTVMICYGLTGAYVLVGLTMSQIRLRYASIVYLFVLIASGLVVWRKGYFRMSGLRGIPRSNGAGAAS
jgi:hypothetical protein